MPPHRSSIIHLCGLQFRVFFMVVRYSANFVSLVAIYYIVSSAALWPTSWPQVIQIQMPLCMLISRCQLRILRTVDSQAAAAEAGAGVSRLRRPGHTQPSRILHRLIVQASRPRLISWRHLFRPCRCRCRTEPVRHDKRSRIERRVRRSRPAPWRRTRRAWDGRRWEAAPGAN